MAIFQVQFPNQNQTKTDHRASQPYNADKKDRIMELMLDWCPNTVPGPKDSEHAVVAKAFTTLSKFGVLQTSIVNGVVEKQGLASVRFQTKGKREITIIFWTTFNKLFAKLGVAVEGSPLDFCWNFCIKMDADMFQKLLDIEPDAVQRAILEPWELLYVPLGAFLFERVLGTENILGMRASTLDHSNKHQWLDLVNVYSSHTDAVPALVNLWKRPQHS